MQGGMQEQVPVLRCKQKLPSCVRMRQTTLPVGGYLVVLNGSCTRAKTGNQPQMTWNLKGSRRKRDVLRGGFSPASVAGLKGVSIKQWG